MTVHFRKNTFPFVSDGKTIAFDCHYHSIYSDGSGTIPEILAEARRLGIGIALTDHNEVAGVVEAVENTLGVPVIPGIEVSCKGMIHLLIYFYDAQDLKDFYEKNIRDYKRTNPIASLKEMTALKIAKLAKQYKCVVALAHPYGGAHREIDSYVATKENKDFLRYVDCVESNNGTIGIKRNTKAWELAKKNNMGIVGGSDGHTITSMGSTLTLAEAKNAHVFLDKLKAKEVIVIGDKVNAYQRYKMAGVITYKHVKATTRKHRTELLTSIGLFALFQRFSIPILFLLGALTYKKVRSKKKK